MGLEFLDVFEEWADHYDTTVHGDDLEYKEVFAKYDELLSTVAERSQGLVLEFGVGTGNLTQRLLDNGHIVIGIEPSKPMRSIAQGKLPVGVMIQEGDFINFPKPTKQVDTIVSTYAFHHLTDKEKMQAISIYRNYLSDNGKIVFADTVFENEEVHKQFIKSANMQGFYHLAEDLQTEYYPTILTLRKCFEENGFSVQFTRWNQYVWVIEATKR